MGNLWQDLRYATRLLARSPGFTSMAVVSLALGIGANSAIFSIVDAVLLKLLPVRAPEELVLVGARSNTNPDPRFDFSHRGFTELRDGSRNVLAGVAAHAWTALSLGTGAQTERVLGEIVTGEYFQVLGVSAILGRTLLPEDDRTPGAHPVAVLGYGCWRRRFGGDPAVLGHTVNLNGIPFTIVGVLPANFTGTEVGMTPDVRVPMMMQARLNPAWDALNRYDRIWLELIGRLRPGVSRPQAEAAMNAIYQRVLEGEARAMPRNMPPQIRRDALERSLALAAGHRGLSRLRNEASKPLWVLMAVVGLVLLIACANVANLLLARGAGRRKEIAVRLAIGAGRGRLVRQLLTESLLLSLAGGALGLLLAFRAGGLLLSLLPQVAPVPLSVEVHPDLRLIAFTFAVSLLTGVLFGLAPALQSTRPDLTASLKDEAGGRLGGRFRLRKALVVAQVALCMVLLVGAGLFMRTLWNLKELDPGFRRESVLLVSLDPSLNGYNDAATQAFYERLSERVSALPGTRSATLARVPPLAGRGMRRTMFVPGYRPRPNEDMNLHLNFVGPRYLETLGIPLLAGREFTSRDRLGAPRVAVVNETMARRFWGRESPIGKRIGAGLPGGAGADIEIVGLAKDVKYRNLRQDVPPTVYVSFLQERRASDMTLHLRTTADPSAAMAAVRAEVQALDRNLPVFDIKTLEEQITTSLLPERLVASLTSAFGLLALALAAVGLYGVVSHSVARRTREIGIRVALGAERAALLAMVLRESLALVCVGLAIGLAGAFALSRVVASLLFGVRSWDLATYLGVALAMSAVALAAAYVPARRASRVDPMAALRYE